jgi:hypothetical protein
MSSSSNMTIESETTTMQQEKAQPSGSQKKSATAHHQYGRAMSSLFNNPLAQPGPSTIRPLAEEADTDEGTETSSETRYFSLSNYDIEDGIPVLTPNASSSSHQALFMFPGPIIPGPIIGGPIIGFNPVSTGISSNPCHSRSRSQSRSRSHSRSQNHSQGQSHG